MSCRQTEPGEPEAVPSEVGGVELSFFVVEEVCCVDADVELVEPRS